MPIQPARLTQPNMKVLRLLLEAPRHGRSGAEISRGTGVKSGTLYPMLARLEVAGWVVGEWEQVDPAEVGRPRRRYYQLTGAGQRAITSALKELQISPAIGELQWNT